MISHTLFYVFDWLRKWCIINVYIYIYMYVYTFSLFQFIVYIFAFSFTDGAMEKPDRNWGEKCVNSDIVISQSPTPPLPNGIPTYTVEILNSCYTGCNISDIHLNCGWFSSVNLINPKIFKRLSYDDCLVNNGEPLVIGETILFEYANTFLYPLSVSSVLCP